MKEMKTNGYICDYCKKYKDQDIDKPVTFDVWTGLKIIDVYEQKTIDLCIDCAGRLLGHIFVPSKSRNRVEILYEEGIL